jgi:hypothetical protein
MRHIGGQFQGREFGDGFVLFAHNACLQGKRRVDQEAPNHPLTMNFPTNRILFIG